MSFLHLNFNAVFIMCWILKIEFNVNYLLQDN